MIMLTDSTPESLGAALRDMVNLAEAGHFDVALRMLVEHDATVRTLCAAARAAEVPRWRVLLEAQQRTVERLVKLRDAAGDQVSSAVRARIVAAAYGNVA
jgi:hypothetical protein